ncbi:MAG: hypothetical protein K1X94_16150 [Sandaracinaceae bacterium]|nr:hypothetical protein [Sandaracinaceae bacterium]
MRAALRLSVLLTFWALLVIAPMRNARAQEELDEVPDETGEGEGPVVRAELPPGIHPLIEGSGRTPLVVVRASTEPSWSRGALRLRRRGWSTVVDRSVDRRALPADVRADLAQVWTLSTSERVVCSARLGTPRVMRRVSATFEVERWEGETGEPRLSDAAVAREAWDLADGTELLVAPVIKLHGRCDDAAWATREVPVFGAADVGNETRALEAFRALPDYQDMASEWREAREYDSDPAAVHWDERAGAGARRVVSFDAGARRFTLIVAEAHEGCGSFVGNVWALFEHEGPRDAPAGESITLRASGRDYDFVPSALVDLDADGSPEILGFQRMHVPTTGVRVDVSELFLGCRC